MIRPATCDDVDALVDVDMSCGNPVYERCDFSKDVIHADVSRRVDEYDVFVYEWQGEIVGYVVINGDQLHWIAVRLDVQRQGIGHALTDLALSKGVTFLHTCAEGNDIAISFFEKMGFVRSDEDILDGEDDVEGVYADGSKAVRFVFKNHNI